jgi:DNA replication protein DnaC
MAGACLSCGYKQPPTEKAGKTKKAPQLEAEGRKNRTIGYYLKYSVWANDSLMSKDFRNFATDTPGQKELLYYGHGVAEQIVRGQTVHALLYGNVGVGKSHIANGILVQIQVDSKWTKTTMFVDWQMLMSRRKAGMHDGHDDVRAQMDAVMTEIGKADVVVIDDLGAERGSDYDVDLANEVFRLREDKSVIVTTNMGGSALKARYGDLTISRMAAHGQGNSYAVKNISDQRREK